MRFLFRLYLVPVYYRIVRADRHITLIHERRRCLQTAWHLAKWRAQ